MVYVRIADDCSQIALTPYARTEYTGQAALLVTNGCISMSNQITMGVDNKP